MWFQQLLQIPELVFWILALEGFVLCILQIVSMRRDIRRSSREEKRKREKLDRLKKEVTAAPSEIPVVKFQKEKKAPERKETYDPAEMLLLQEMISEFFG